MWLPLRTVLCDITLIGINKYFLHSQMTSCAMLMRYDIMYHGGLTALPLPAWFKGNGYRCYAGCQADIIYIYIINFHRIFICVKGSFAHLLAFILWVSAGSQGFLRKKE